MAVFDIKTFFESLNQGQGTLNAIGTAFGFPSCLLNLTSALLKLIPSSVLRKIKGDAQSSRDRADDLLKEIDSWNRWISGILELDAPGGLSWMSDTSEAGKEQNESLFARRLRQINDALRIAGDMYANYNAASGAVAQIKDCLNSYSNYINYNGGLAAQYREDLDKRSFDLFNADQATLTDTKEVINLLDQLINNIDSVLIDRKLDPKKEPIFIASSVDQYKDFKSLGIEVSSTTVTPVVEASSVFRLVFAPPKSKSGQFVLSRDGLYFDSQTSGLTLALREVASNKSKIQDGYRWKFENDPNIGGRGKGFSTNDLNSYINTILDPNIIDDVSYITQYYKADGFLQDLIGQRNKRIYDLSAQITELENSSASQSIIFNYKQSLISESAQHLDKINKRKKQIELAIKLPGFPGYTGNLRYQIGDVPINDFSYLSGINIFLDIKKQKALTFSQVDISGVVLPIETRYVISQPPAKTITLDHLLVTDLAEGAIIYDGSSVSSVNPVILDIENKLTTDNLLGIYNFLTTDVVNPSSTIFNVRNSSEDTEVNYAQLVSESSEFVFNQGLGIPYLHGITKQSSIDQTIASGVGSYVKLPAQQSFDDLLYNLDGATVDFWVHVPNINQSSSYNYNGASGLYRLVLACENVGINGEPTITDTEIVSNNFGNTYVRGFMMGFSRDRRLSKGSAASNVDADNPATSSVFFIAPTQSINASAVALVNRASYDNDNCTVGSNFHAMAVPISKNVNGNYLSSCGNKFCHIAVTFDPKIDSVSFYLDGKELATSSMSYVFGTPKNTMPNLPNFRKDNSFEYDRTTVGDLSTSSLKYGPRLNTYYTPWIVGGGYTDGMYSKGNFMGGTYGGVISGLKGYLGSLKFYSKPLNSTEILNNYNTQKGFFENIDI